MAFLEKIMDWDQALFLSINSYHQPWLDRFMWLFSETLMWIPVLLFLVYVLIKNKKTQAFLLIFTFALLILFTDQIASSLIKPLVERLRPTHDPEIGHLVNVVNNYKGGDFGFISSHFNESRTKITTNHLISTFSQIKHLRACTTGHIKHCVNMLLFQ